MIIEQPSSNGTTEFLISPHRHVVPDSARLAAREYCRTQAVFTRVAIQNAISGEIVATYAGCLTAEEFYTLETKRHIKNAMKDKDDAPHH